MLGASEPLQNGVTRDPSSVKRKPGFAGMSSAVFSARPIIDLFKVGSHGRKSRAVTGCCLRDRRPEIRATIFILAQVAH